MFPTHKLKVLFNSQRVLDPAALGASTPDRLEMKRAGAYSCQTPLMKKVKSVIPVINEVHSCTRNDSKAEKRTGTSAARINGLDGDL